MTAPVADRPVRARPPLRADVQALRALAVGLVLAGHVWDHPSGGFLGVDVFFVVSGYLITGLLLREATRTGSVSIRAFYVRRARRLLPASLLVLAATWLASRALLTPLRAEQTGEDSLWALLFAANVRFADLGTDYFTQDRPASPVQHYWSLSVEEQFYVVWPLVLLVLAVGVRRRVRDRDRERALRWGTAALAILVGVASLALCVAAVRSDPTGTYFDTRARAWELAAGALAACLHPRLSRLGDGLRSAAAWAGLFAVVVSAVLVTETTTWPGPATLVPVLGTAALLVAGDPRRGPGATGWARSRAAQRLGLLSYSLYLWHWPVMILAQAWNGGASTGLRIGVTVVSLVLAELTFRFVEEPVHRGVPAERRPAVAGRALVTVGVVAALALGAALLPQRGPAPPVTAAAGTQDPVVLALAARDWPELVPAVEDLPDSASPEWREDDCLDVGLSDVERCTYGDPDGPRTAVVVGDSIAASYLPGLRRALGDDWRIVPLTRQQCPFVDLPTHRVAEQRYESCYVQRDVAVREVARIEPELVVVSGSSSVFAGRVLGLPPDPAGNAAAWRDGLTALLQPVVRAAGRVVVLGEPPGGANLQTCASSRRSSPASCVAPLRPAWSALSRAEAAAAASAGASYVDPAPWFCASGLCPAFVGSTPVYWDGKHLTRQASAELAPRLRASLLGTR